MAVDLTQPQAIAERVLFEDGDTGTVHREPIPSTTFEPETGNYVKPAPVLVYDGALTISDQTQGNTGGQAQQGAVPATWQRWLIKVPLGAPEIKVGDVVTVVTARDASLVGHRYVVRDAGGGTFKVVKRLQCGRWAPGSTEDWMKP